MADSPPYCTIPALLGPKFAAWFDANFTDNCHLHDQEYGVNTMVPRWIADATLFVGIWAKNKPTAVLAWLIVRVAIWKYKRQKLINGVAETAPWYYKL